MSIGYIGGALRSGSMNLYLLLTHNIPLDVIYFSRYKHQSLYIIRGVVRKRIYIYIRAAGMFKT